MDKLTSLGRPVSTAMAGFDTGATDEYCCFIETDKGRVGVSAFAAYGMLISFLKQVTPNDEQTVKTPSGPMAFQTNATVDAIDAIIKNSNVWEMLVASPIGFTLREK